MEEGKAWRNWFKGGNALSLKTQGPRNTQIPITNFRTLLGFGHWDFLGPWSLGLQNPLFILSPSA